MVKTIQAGVAQLIGAYSCTSQGGGFDFYILLILSLFFHISSQYAHAHDHYCLNTVSFSFACVTH